MADQDWEPRAASPGGIIAGADRGRAVMNLANLGERPRLRDIGDDDGQPGCAGQCFASTLVFVFAAPDDDAACTGIETALCQCEPHP